ncbi:molybdopterin-dependent oxidoreductase [soil metagenome]
MPGLGTSFGRGGATTAQQDLANSDCILIEGSSMAEAHPVAFRWVMKAKERGATVIHVDPRFSRTSALADIWVPIRAGSDIAFLGGLIRHVLENDLFFRDYVVGYTNAPCILKNEFADSEDGYFDGWDEASRSYARDAWLYEGDSLVHPRRDDSLQHPRCVYQSLRRHYARYTPEMVERACGIPPALFHEVAEKFCAASGRDKTGCVCYAVGWTQHSKGAQVIRAASILQLLLGNIGRPGGGILALRGHASIQGSTDIPTLYDILPGYITMPRAGRGEDSMDGFLGNHRNAAGLWHHLPSYLVSLLKAYYGKRATPENDFGYGWLPKITEDHSHFKFLYQMAEGKVEGMFLMGQNPAVGAPNARVERKALSMLKWLVVRDLVEIESANFWRDSPEVERGELAAESVGTEVFLFPAAGHAEKSGTFTNTQRLVQWRRKAVEPEGDRRSEGWFVHQLALRLKAKAEDSGRPEDEALRALDWWYPSSADGEPEMGAVLAEINGWRTAPDPQGKGVVHGRDRGGASHHGAQLDDYSEIRADGSTAVGCWIYTGVFGSDGANKADARDPESALGHGWGFAWPDDRRILYNRASAAPDGTPWSDAKKLVWWDAEAARWTGIDRPDFVSNKAPGYRPDLEGSGTDAQRGDAPFILHDDGLGWIFAPLGMEDGPLPNHYEPLESPVHNPLYRRDTNPPANWFSRADNRFAPPGCEFFPYVLTTYRLTEHHTAGGMSRFLPHLSELQPALFAEISPELAAALGVENGAPVCIVSWRGAVEALALVSRRIRPLQLGTTTVHQVAIPFHFGSAGPVRGDVANDLLAISGEPNVTIMEAKALLCNIVPGRLPRGPAYLDWLRHHVPAATGAVSHPEEPPPEAPWGGGIASQHGQHGQHGRSYDQSP